MLPPIDINKIWTQPLSLPLYREKQVAVSVLRLDLIHSVISGNKLFKLRYYIDDAKQLGKTTLVTFGGAWSNHILATAAAARINGFNCIGLIRGEEPIQHSPILEEAKSLGMDLQFLERSAYRDKKIPPHLLHTDNYIINEGGYGIQGAEGAATMLDHCNPEDYTHICCATGTGTTMAGLLMKSLRGQTVIGINVLKNQPETEINIRNLAVDLMKNGQVIYDYHFGGYAKFNAELILFMNEFFSATAIPSDFVYTAKLFYAIDDLIRQDFFPRQTKLLIIHSGGLHGNRSLKKGTLIF